MTKQNNSLFFADGHIINNKALIIAAQFNAYPDADISRVILRYAGQWVKNDCRSDMLRSVTYSSVLGRCYFAGPNGIIRWVGAPNKPFTLENIKGTFDEIRIIDTEKYGEIFRIRAIGNSVYTCGQSGQVYALSDGNWIHMDAGILGDDGETLEDIDGTSEDDLYAVGLGGAVFHYNGTRWTQLDFPSNQHLSNVRCLSKDEVYICGNNGVLYRGNKEQWEFIGDSDCTLNFWGMDKYKDSLFLSHSQGLMVYNGKSLSDVTLPKKQVSFYRLHANDEQLLSIGIDDIYLYDGEQWEELVWPDNAPPLKNNKALKH